MTICSASSICSSSEKQVRKAIVLFVLLLPTVLFAQLRRTTIGEWTFPESSTTTSFGGDTLPKSNWSKKWSMPHSPLRATVYSAVLPGAGQIYNKKYWKLPILYAGLGTCTYFIIDNTREYRKWRDSYIAAFDGNPNTVPQYDPSEYRLEYAQDLYRRWTELSYIAFIAVYLIQVVDANVDAHLFYFDVSRDLGMHIHPTLLNTGRVMPGIGLSIRM